MTDLNKKIRWETYIRSALDNCQTVEELDKTIEQLYEKFNIEELQTFIIDIYIRRKEKLFGYKKDNSFLDSYALQNRYKREKEIIDALLNQE